VSDVEKQVAAAKAGIATAQAARARAEHQYQVAQAQAEASARDLKEEFGAASLQEARERIASLEAELEAECSRVREALSRTGRGEQ
jgi:F0F1-type ATP synthase membrane subunit b/b'